MPVIAAFFKIIKLQNRSNKNVYKNVEDKKYYKPEASV
jgi:hypothetical protein